MTAHDLEAMRIADAGIEAGHSLWGAIYAANIRHEVRTFEAALEQITEEIEDEHERKLFEASAMRAIPISSISTEHRDDITDKYDAAYVHLVHARQADEDAAAGDWAYDAARDEQLLGDAA